MANVEAIISRGARVRSLAEHWWALAIRGAAAIIFGVLLLAYPRIGLLALVFLFAAYAVIDGVCNVVAAVRHARERQRWGWLAFSGVMSILAGVVVVLWPAISVVALLLLIAAWALVTGIAQLVTAIRLREEIEGEWLLGLSGIVSVAFGVLVALNPAMGALALVFWIGIFEIVFGALVVALSLELRSWHKRAQRRPPIEGVATPA